MELCRVVHRTPIIPTYRSDLIRGMFDLPGNTHAVHEFHVRIPADEDHWKIGLIVGPSGTGKSSIARERWPANYIGFRRHDWPTEHAIVDGFRHDSDVDQIVHCLTAAGLSSPPHWIQPYHTLSTGQQFRASTARALDDAKNLPANIAVIDEFTSVVDRTVAASTSAAISKAIRTNRIKARLVAVTCHYDVAPWLAPDWIMDMATGKLSRGCLRRPQIELDLYRAEPDAWKLFAPYHYLNASIHPAARRWIAYWKSSPVAFSATLSQIAVRNCRRITRIVVLPDFQGLGIGSAIADATAELETSEGHRCTITTSHPALRSHFHDSPKWRYVKSMNRGRSSPRQNASRDHYHAAIARPTSSFEYRTITNSQPGHRPRNGRTRATHSPP